MSLHGVSVLVRHLPAALDGDEEQESSQRANAIHCLNVRICLKQHMRKVFYLNTPNLMQREQEKYRKYSHLRSCEWRVGKRGCEVLSSGAVSWSLLDELGLI